MFFLKFLIIELSLIVGVQSTQEKVHPLLLPSNRGKIVVNFQDLISTPEKLTLGWHYDHINDSLCAAETLFFVVDILVTTQQGLETTNSYETRMQTFTLNYTALTSDHLIRVSVTNGNGSSPCARSLYSYRFNKRKFQSSR